MIDRPEFDELFARCSNWGRWGDADTRGALNLIDNASVVRAGAEIREGVSISLGRDLETIVGPDNPAPLLHHMLSLPDSASTSGLSGASDFLAVACHGEAHAHVDALCHIAFDGQLYNGWSAGSVTASGAEVGGLSEASDGIVSRAVLLDLADRAGGSWLPGGYAISPDELAESLRATGTEVHPGDVLLVRTGQALRRKTEGAWDSASEKAGLHPRAMLWLKERDISAVGFDGDGDSAPSLCEGISYPIHVLGINAMGLHFFDSLDLDTLAAECVARQRWSACFLGLPLRVPRATGCPINPVAIL